MVYIDPRDRKFQFIVVVPIVLAALLLTWGVIDGGTEVELFAVLLGLIAAICFVIYFVTTMVLERVRG